MGVKFFGQYLLEKGKITREQLLEAVEFQKGINLSLGTIALEKRLLNSEQIKKIHNEQKRVDKKFGEIAVEWGLITQEELNELLMEQKNTRIYFGESLVQKKLLTLEELEQELNEYKKEQEKDEREILLMIKGIKNNEIVEAFVDLTIKMFLRIARQIIKVGGCSSVKEFPLYNYTIEQNATGDKSLSYILNMSQDIFLNIASTMYEKEIKEVNEEVTDAVCEFVNIITGNSCSKLSTISIKLSTTPPKFYDNSKLRYTITPGKETVLLPLKATQGEVCVVVNVI